MLRYLPRRPLLHVRKNFPTKYLNQRVLVFVNMSSDQTAGIIIIGDEILKGQTADTNSYFLTQRLFSLGIKLHKISVIGDSLEDIAKEVSTFSEKFTHVITSGGIGPTHDDVTYQGVAMGLREQLVLLPPLVTLMQSYFPDVVKKELADYNAMNPPSFAPDSDLSGISPVLKMALVPSGSQLHYLRKADGTSASKFPIIQVRNVYIFPGVPQLMERAFQCFEQNLVAPTCKFYTRELYLKASEWTAAPILTLAVKEFDGQVTFGSYPVMNHNYYSTKLTMESTNQEYVQKAHDYLVSKLPVESIVNFDPQSVSHAAQRVDEVINSTADEDLKEPLSKACQVIENCLTSYEPSQVCVCFNGGKDCTALLHLVYALFKKNHPQYQGKLQAMYIKGVDTFPEMESFIEESRRRYDLDLWTVEGPIRPGLASILEQHPHVKAVFMGTRRTDPHAATLEPFQMTDPGWPSVMRVSPILDWSYQQVWKFLRKLSVPYCTLYDKGYTSIGNRSNTKPNPALRFVDHSGNEMYHPAYLLDDCLTERQGRL